MLAGLADVNERRAEHLRILRHGLERIIVELVLFVAFCTGIRVLLKSFWSAHAITPCQHWACTLPRREDRDDDTEPKESERTRTAHDETRVRNFCSGWSRR